MPLTWGGILARPEENWYCWSEGRRTTIADVGQLVPNVEEQGLEGSLGLTRPEARCSPFKLGLSRRPSSPGTLNDHVARQHVIALSPRKSKHETIEFDARQSLTTVILERDCMAFGPLADSQSGFGLQLS